MRLKKGREASKAEKQAEQGALIMFKIIMAQEKPRFFASATPFAALPPQ